MNEWFLVKYKLLGFPTKNLLLLLLLLLLNKGPYFANSHNPIVLAENLMLFPQNFTIFANIYS